MLCQKCLTGRTGDVVGASCRTPGCDGIIEAEPVFSTLVDALPESMTCRRRLENGDQGEGMDRWQKFKSNGNRVCSYCGSLHPEDMFALVKLSAEAPEDAKYRDVVAIEPSDKGYKVYIHQPGVRNAMEGGIKFYMQHVPRNPDGSLAATEGQQKEYGEAIRRTRARFEGYMVEQFGGKR